ncbi:MAG TPA: hypothetical protein VNI52_08185 [Sphingobacteriaceae bacterium]|nr:hypothetical protein [Sphingobacteriaceae bacterium]
MSDKTKKWFLAVCIAIPFLVYCIYYYGIMIKNAPYKFSEFESITLKYGLGTDLVNQYNSKTGEYRYLNERDSLINTKVKLTKDDLLYLHRKAADLGFWNFPEAIEGRQDPKRPINSPHYYLEYTYQRKKKHMLFDLNYSDDAKLQTAAKTLVDEVSKTIIDAQQRGK